LGREILPGMVKEVLDIELELQDKYTKKKPLWPLEAVDKFQLLYRTRS
jgi:hypothetical protein